MPNTRERLSLFWIVALFGKPGLGQELSRSASEADCPPIRSRNGSIVTTRACNPLVSQRYVPQQK